MGARCTTVVDGTSPWHLAPCSCSSFSSSSPATVSVNARTSPVSRSSHRSRGSASEGSRSASRLPAGEDAVTSTHLGDFSVAAKKGATRVGDKGEVIEGVSPTKKSSTSGSKESSGAIALETEDLFMQSGLPESLNVNSISAIPDAETGFGSESSGLQSCIPSFAVGSLKELKTFRQFLKPRHNTLDEAYDSLLGYAMVLDEKRFMDRMEELEYMGNSQRLFYALATDGSGTITREAMKEHLRSVNNLFLPTKKSISFGYVAFHDSIPLDQCAAKMRPTEILVEEAEEAKESRPKASYKEESMNFLEIRRTQPGASGQPASGS